MDRLPRLKLLALFLIIAAITAVFPARAQQPIPAQDATLDLSLRTVIQAGRLSGPVDITHAGDARLFVVERAGRIRIIGPDGELEATPFLDIEDRVHRKHSEQGLLGLVFHPHYAVSDAAGYGTFYVNYTAEPSGDTRISRFSVTADPDIAEPDSEQLVLEIEQPYDNHNAGDLAFSPHDGYLYIPLGDGGSGNDPDNRAQNMGMLWGKMLRLDVDGSGGVQPDCGSGDAYTIPADNPFVDGPGGDCDEIWALGLRNPWRFSFDRLNGDLYIADVGQRRREEVNWQPVSSGGGENYGWPCYEGSLEHFTDRPFCQDDPAPYTMPVFELDRSAGVCAITGGFVYRGARFPTMVGRYLLSDFCEPAIWDLETAGAAWSVTRHDDLQDQLGGIATFGEDVAGEIYLANLFDGVIYHLTADAPINIEDADILLPLFLN